MRTVLLPAQSLAVDQAVAALALGGLVAMPTETVYGLAADASHPAAVARIYALKRRPAGHPLIVHIASAQAIEAWARDIPSAALRLAEHFWPGPLTLILKRQPWVADIVTGGQETVALRVPGHPIARELLRRFGLAHSGGVAAPSANRYGGVSPTRLDHVRTEFAAGIDVFVDGGSCEIGIESTIVDLSRDRPFLLRPGAIHADRIAQTLGESLSSVDAQAPRVPGSTASHYAPATPTFLCPAASLDREIKRHRPHEIGVLACRDAVQDGTVWLRAPNEPEGYGKVLYAGLRQLDSARLSAILVEKPPSDRAWDAIHDRLRRACRLLEPSEKPT